MTEPSLISQLSILFKSNKFSPCKPVQCKGVQKTHGCFASKFTTELAVNEAMWLSLSSSLPCHHRDA